MAVGTADAVAAGGHTSTVPAMTLPTLMPLLQKSAEYLGARGITNGKREAEWIFAEALGLSRLELYTRFDMPLPDPDVVRLRALVQRRGKREPLAYVLGSQPFHGLKLRVGPGALVPRPETEELVERVLADLAAGPVRVIDVGTGSGAIALALKHARPEARVEACDLSDEALTYARANGEQLGLAVEWRQADLLAGSDVRYDAIVANLPYIAEDERAQCDPELAFEPAGALFADDAGLAVIARLVAQAARLLAPGGRLWLEHGWKQGEGIRALAAAHGFACDILPDLAGRDRFARLTHG